MKKRLFAPREKFYQRNESQRQTERALVNSMNSWKTKSSIRRSDMRSWRPQSLQKTKRCHMPRRFRRRVERWWTRRQRRRKKDRLKSTHVWQAARARGQDHASQRIVAPTIVRTKGRRADLQRPTLWAKQSLNASSAQLSPRRLPECNARAKSRKHCTRMAWRGS